MAIVIRSGICLSLRRKMSWKVLITARVFKTLGQAALDLLRANDCEVITPERLGPLKLEELLPAIAGIEATLCSPDQYNGKALQAAETKNLKIISRWGVGFDSIDIAEATRQGIVVAYTPGMLNETVADWTWALLLGIARRVPEGHNSVAKGEWTNYWGHNVHGKTLGLIGCGRIGQAVAKRASGFDMRVIGYDIAAPQGTNIELVSLDELLARSDFVSLHAALTPENRGLIGEAQLRKMKGDAYLVNTARGPLIDEAALIAALDSGQLGGAALDVVASEPLAKDSPLLGRDNVIITPHTAFYSVEALEELQTKCASDVARVLSGEKAVYPISA